MTKSDLLRIHGIGEYAADALVRDGVTTAAGLEKALRELEPAAGHIYSSFQLAVLDELNLPKIGSSTVSQYTRRTDAEDEIVYEWERETETFVVELRKEGDAFRAEWSSSSEKDPFRSDLYEQRSDAVAALTRWAYRPPESA
ncbi:hypothetical protein [Halorussus pelagicus]|uniref:hypothetical protein n=1 Tax=Halorussus pelagicus TaxID=2505977 RepID=UPI000FFB18D3|nr:hypothetical protein [Halorussus pelagicus]